MELEYCIGTWNQNLHLCNLEQARLFVLEPVGWVSAFGIDMLRYELTICHGTLINISYEFSNKTFEEDPFYYNEIEGFLNVTALNQAPVFLSYNFPSDAPDLYSNGNFYGAFAEWWQKIDGMNPIRERDITLIDIEPITGKGMYHNNLCIFLYVSQCYGHGKECKLMFTSVIRSRSISMPIICICSESMVAILLLKPKHM